MTEKQRRRMRKWLILGSAGFGSGLIALFILKSIRMASGTAATIVVAIIALKHLALLVSIGSPTMALFQSLKFKARRYCPWPPD
jgi:hypothetical protein